MKYLFLLIPIIAYAADNCDEDLSSVVATAKTLSLPNCYTKKNARQIFRDSEEFCASDCRDQFAKFYGQKPEMKTSELQKMFLNSSFDEYKKISSIIWFLLQSYEACLQRGQALKNLLSPVI